jgi:hypothetical protein
MKWVGKHAEAEASGKSDGFAQWRFWDTGLVDRLTEDRWKRAYRHVSSPRTMAELVQYSQGSSVIEKLVRSRSLDTLIVVKLCHAVFAPSNT